jgi:DNA primase
VNYDPDTAGQTATDRSLTLLLEKEFDVRVLSLPGGADPDKFLQEQGPEAYSKLLTQSPTYLDYLIGRARLMDRTTAAGKVAALNFLMPYVQRLPNRLLRSEWATRIASELRVDEPVLREALRKAAAERRDTVKPSVELLGSPLKPAERRIMAMLVEAEGFREKLAAELLADGLHRGLESERILEMLIAKAGEPSDAPSFAAALDEKDRRLLFAVLFETSVEHTWEEAESCLRVLRNRRVEEELFDLQKRIETKLPSEELGRLLTRRLELQKKLAHD